MRRTFRARLIMSLLKFVARRVRVQLKCKLSHMLRSAVKESTLDSCARDVSFADKFQGECKVHVLRAFCCAVSLEVLSEVVNL